MTLQDLGAIGEFLGLFAILITLFYLAKQTKQSVALSRGKETRTLIDQFNVYLRLMTAPAHLQPMRDALVSFRSMDADSQARAFVVLAQWVNFYEQCLYAFESGLLPEPVLDALRAYVVGILITPGGREFWEDFQHVFGSDVSAKLNELIEGGGALPPLITETYPWLRPNSGDGSGSGEIEPPGPAI